MKIIEYLKFLSTIRDRISDLCKQSLFEKWYKGSKKDLHDPCPFCKESSCRESDDCIICLCPPEICSEGGWDGYFSFISNKLIIYKTYKQVLFVSDSDMDVIIKMFKKWIINDEGEKEVHPVH